MKNLTVDEWKAFLRTFTPIDLTQFPSEARIIRKAISELRKEGIIFIPVERYLYADIARNPQLREKAVAFAQAQKKAWLTQYFNTVKPLKDYLTEEDLKEMMGVLV